MVTLDDVAARAGVSRMTASNALRGKTVVRPETARKVIAAAEELGYHPNLAARQLSSGRTHVIGLTVADFDLIFPAALAAAISDRAQTLGYQVIVQQTRFSHDFERRMLSSASANAVSAAAMRFPLMADDFLSSNFDVSRLKKGLQTLGAVYSVYILPYSFGACQPRGAIRQRFPSPRHKNAARAFTRAAFLIPP